MSQRKGLIVRKKVTLRKRVGKCELTLFASPEDLKKTPIVLGFPNLGVTPILVANYLAEQMHLPVIGSITSPTLEASTVLVDSQPIAPIRIMGDSRVLIVTSEMKIPETIEKSLIETIIELARILDHSMIFCVEGIPVKDLQDTQRSVVDFISTSEELVNKLEGFNHKAISEAVITGPTGQMLLRAALDDSSIADAPEDLPERAKSLSLSTDGQNLPDVTALLVNASTLYPDVLSALVVIRLLDNVLDGALSVDLTAIERKAATIEDKVKDLIMGAKSSDSSFQTMFS